MNHSSSGSPGSTGQSILMKDDESQADESVRSGLSSLRAAGIATSIFLVLFLTTCNISVLSTIQSAIATDLHATTETSWFVSAFLIAVASITPISGKLCQIFTARLYLLGSIIFQAIGLVVTGLAPNIFIFIVGRIVYGLGVAAVAPVALILITEHATPQWRGTFFGLLNCGYTVGVASGAIIGGALESVVGWRAIFWMQVPLILMLSLTAFLSIPKNATAVDEHDQKHTTWHKLAEIDHLGILTMVSSVVLLMYSLSAPHLEIIPAVLSVAALALFILVETKWATDPIIPYEVLSSRGCMLSGIVTVGVMGARWGVLFYIPTYGIAVRLWFPERAGALLVPTNCGFALGGVVVGALHVKHSGSFYFSTLVSIVLFAATQFAIAMICIPDTSVVVLILVLFLNGFVVSAVITYALAHLLYVTQVKHHATVLAIISTFRALAGAFGSALSGGTFLRALQAYLINGFNDVGLLNEYRLIQQLLGRPMLVQQLYGVRQHVAISSYASSLKVMYVVGAGMILITVLIQAAVGRRAADESTSDISEREPLLTEARAATVEPEG